MQWYYLDANKQQVPFDENYLQPLINDGTVNSQTLLWNESLPEWRPANALFPDTFPGAQNPPAQQTTQSQASSKPASSQLSAPKKLNDDLRETIMDLASYLSANAGWIKFFGIMLIIGGVANLLILIGALHIWIGVILLKAADQAKIAERTGSKEVLEQSLYQMGRFFKINGIVFIVIMSIYALFIVVFIAMGGFALLMGVGAAAGAGMESIPDEF